MEHYTLNDVYAGSVSFRVWVCQELSQAEAMQKMIDNYRAPKKEPFNGPL
jgi:hypothetical protein